LKKILFFALLVLIAHIFLSVCLLVGSCSYPQNEGFAIYLTKDDVPPAKMEMLSHVDIAEKPVIGIDDIITYDTGTHEITLTDDAYERITKLEVPVQGTSFLVCVDKAPVYWGAFWVGFSSLSFDGVTIWKPLSVQGDKVIALTPGYPSPSFYSGEDPRNNAAVIEALEKSGKLINKPSTEMLPRSFKGYELYSWTKYGQWYFTLITGTNRTKTVEEIITGESGIIEDGWVNIRVTGTGAIKAVLSRLPENEDVSWLPQPMVMEGPVDDINFSLPDGTVLDDIKEHAAQCGLNLHAWS
jgi:hypothetical protein